METSDSLLERIAAAPTDDDWRRLNDLYPLWTSGLKLPGWPILRHSLRVPPPNGGMGPR
jgi:hypothetical protein